MRSFQRPVNWPPVRAREIHQSAGPKATDQPFWRFSVDEGPAGARDGCVVTKNTIAGYRVRFTRLLMLSDGAVDCDAVAAAADSPSPAAASASSLRCAHIRANRHRVDA